jgi:hypothetical protein
MYRFERRTDDELVLTLFEGEVALLTMLLAELRALLLQPERDNAATERLFPRAYLDPTEEEAETDWQSLVHDDLVREKVIALDAVHAALERPSPGPEGSRQFTLDRAVEEQFLLSVNDARLAFAALAGVAGETGPESAGADDPIPVAELIEWLGHLVEDLIDLKLADLPD